jgi:hypothetical protein
MFLCFFGLKNVFPTVKILTFSRGEFKYVQMDQGLPIEYFDGETFGKRAGNLPWFRRGFGTAFIGQKQLQIFRQKTVGSDILLCSPAPSYE